MATLKYWDGTAWRLLAAQGPQGPTFEYYATGGAGTAKSAINNQYTRLAIGSIGLTIQSEDNFTDNADGTLTVDADGLYVVSCTINCPAPSSGVRGGLYFSANNVLPADPLPGITVQQEFQTTSSTGIHNVCRVVWIAANTRIMPCVFNRGTAVNMQVLDFGIARLGAGPAGAVGVDGAPGGAVYSRTIGDGSATSFTVSHNLSSRNVSVTCYRSAAPYDEVEVDVERTDIQTVTVRTYPTVPALGEYTVFVQAAGQQATLNITMDTWHQVGAAGEPAFENSWTNYDVTRPLKFRKTPDGRVVFTGIVKGGTSGLNVFTLPVGYRPPTATNFPIYANTQDAYVSVGTQGFVTPANLGTSNVNASADLANIEFDTESVLQTASVAAQPLDAWHNVGAAGEPAFMGTWANASGSSYSPLAFRKYPDGRVRIKGSVTAGANNTPIFTLPAAYRPANNAGVQQIFPILINYGASVGYLLVASTGVVTLAGVAGATITTGSVHEVNGVEFDSETVAAYATGVLGPPVVTALPTNPIDGQEVRLSVSAGTSDNRVLWHLRYDASSPNASKWDYLGGPPIHIEDFATRTTTSTAMVVVPTAPAITVPVAGVYDVTHILEGFNALTNGYVIQDINAESGNRRIYLVSAVAITTEKTARMGPVGAGYTFQIVNRASTAGGTATMQYRALRVTPVRVG